MPRRWLRTGAALALAVAVGAAAARAQITPAPTSTPTKTPLPTSTPVKTPLPPATPTKTVPPPPPLTITPSPTATPVKTPQPTATPTKTVSPTPTPVAGRRMTVSGRVGALDREQRHFRLLGTRRGGSEGERRRGRLVGALQVVWNETTRFVRKVPAIRAAGPAELEEGVAVTVKGRTDAEGRLTADDVVLHGRGVTATPTPSPTPIPSPPPGAAPPTPPTPPTPPRRPTPPPPR